MSIEKKLNILLYNVTTTLKVGGVEIFYISIAKALQSEHNVILCSGYTKNMPSNIVDLSVNKVMFKFIPREKVPNLGNRFCKFIERFSFYFNSRKFLSSQKFDVLIVHKPFDFFLAYILKSKDKRIKTIFVSGGEDFYFFDKFFIRFIDKIISVSRSNAEILEKRYSRKVLILPNGVDKDIFKPDEDLRENIRKKLDLKSNELVFGSVGRVVGLKGFSLVIKILNRFPNAKYLLCGDGEYLNNLKDLAKRLHVEDKVMFAGEIAHKNLNGYINAMDIYIQPTIGNEAFGITVIEALSCDKICVVSDNGGMKDIVEDGVNGYKFKIGDEEDLGRKISIAINNKDNVNPRKSIENKYNWDDFAKEICL